MWLLLAAALSWSLSPEIAVDPHTRVIPAEGYQASPDIASNGTDALAVWMDHRSWFTGPAARMTRLHGEHPLEPFGTEIAADAAAVQVASDGHDYLVAYSLPSGTFDGQPRSAHAAHIEQGRITRRTDIGSGTVVDVASDGGTYCVIAGDEYDTASPTAIVLALDGTVLATHKLPARGQAVLPRQEDGYWVVAIVDQIIQLIPVTSSAIGEGHPVRAVPGVKHVSAIAGRNQILLSWKPDSRLAYLLLDGTRQQVGAFTLLRYYGDVPPAPTLAWDGREFLIASRLSTGVHAVRVGMDGTQLDPLPVRVAGEATGVAAAFDGRRTILLTTEWPEPHHYLEAPTTHARLIESFATYTERPGAVITFSGQAQSYVGGGSRDGAILALATNGSGVLRHADGSTTRVEAGLPNQRYGFAVDSIVGANDVFLVVFRTGIVPSTGVAVRCVRSDGTVLEPVFFPTTLNAIEPAAATDGRGFLVVWNEERFSLRGARLAMDGALESVVTIAPVSTYISDLDVAWAGEAFVVTWEPQAGSTYAIARVDADGTPRGTPRHFPRAADLDEAYTTVAAGANGDGALVLRAERGCLSAIPLGRDGSLLREPRPVLCDQELGVFPDLDIVWDGAAYTVAWSAGLFVDRVPALRTTRDGTVLTPVQDLAPARTAATKSTLFRAGDQLHVLYHRVAPEEPYGGVTRAFIRLLDDAGTPRRTRAARH